jgi:hypothetical protein
MFCIVTKPFPSWSLGRRKVYKYLTKLNSSLEGGGSLKARRWVLFQTPLPNFVRTPLKGRV